MRRHVKMVVRVVNYFGHAAVASWRSAAPGTVLGSMIPDFSTMSGARVESTADLDLAAGIELHHATDAAFHTLPAVTGLMRELDDALARRSCARGPRRAVAHIGIELMLDGVLVREPGYREAYERGIAHEPRGIAWKDAGDDARFAKLIERLRTYGVPHDLERVDAIVHRLSRILGHRPLLAPSPGDLRAIAASLTELQPRVTVATDTVLRALRAALTP
jgi:acyl carrier protein phosphodiesterase